MSTEYYYRYNWCSHCGSYDEIPLLTSSAGWNPLWYSHTHPANISSVKELKEFMAAHPGTIFDEYERDITAEAFFDLMKPVSTMKDRQSDHFMSIKKDAEGNAFARSPEWQDDTGIADNAILLCGTIIQIESTTSDTTTYILYPSAVRPGMEGKTTVNTQEALAVTKVSLPLLSREGKDDPFDHNNSPMWHLLLNRMVYYTGGVTLVLDVQDQAKVAKYLMAVIRRNRLTVDLKTLLVIQNIVANYEKESITMATPPSLEAHSKDYKDGSWRNYSHEELGQWIAHLVKRASHRATKEKRTKDLYDARNYLSMMIAKFEEDSVLPQSTE